MTSRALPIALILAAAPLALLPSEASAAFAGRNGSLLTSQSYCTDADSSGCLTYEYRRLGLFRPRGNRYLYPVTGHDTDVYSAAWSPSGSQVAMTMAGTEGPPAESVYLVDAGDLRRERLDSEGPAGAPVPGTAGVAGLDWSSDGRRLAIGQGGQIFTLSVDGMGRRQVTRAGGDDPAWSTNDVIAFERTRRAPTVHAPTDIYVVSADGGRARRITYRGGQDPDWAPTGRRLVFWRNGNLHLIRRDGRGRRLLVRDGFSPVWSPNGRWIAFIREINKVDQAECDPDCGTPIVYLIRPNGRDLHRGRLRRRPGARHGLVIMADRVEDWQPR